MSYEYLNPDRLRSFKLAKEIGRVPEYKIPLTPEQEDKVNRILQESLLFDFYNNPIVLPENMEEFQDYSRRGRFWTAYEGMRESGIHACLNGFESLSYISSTIGYQFTDVVYDLGMRFSDFEHHKDQVIIARFAKDIFKAKGEGKVAMVAHLLTISEGEERIEQIWD
jgi:membrane dipeptidase